MKKSISLIYSIVGLTIVSCAQGTPTAIQEAFKSKFPTAKYVKWEKENETEWEAEFKLDGIAYSANFDGDGTWKETEHSVKTSDLPLAIKSTLIKDFQAYKIEEIEMVEKPSFKGYDIEIEKGEEHLELVFDMNGKLIEQKNASSTTIIKAEKED